MKHIMLVIGVLGVALLAATGAASAQPPDNVETVRIEGDNQQINLCNGQILHTTATYTITFHYSEDLDGGVRGAGQVHYVGTAVSEDGTRYRVLQNGANHLMFNTKNGMFVGTSAVRLLFISEDETMNFIQSSTFHLVIDDGTPSVVIDHHETKCVGRS